MAKIRDYLGQHRWHIVYKVSAIHDKESALKWVADLTDIKSFCIKSIALSTGNTYKVEVPSRLFSKEKFIESYQDYEFDKISINFNFHQYSVVLLIDLIDNTVDLMFPKKTMIDYKMIEDYLNLND